ncbi:non-ribosomal peptide synthetase, partial [Chitinophaga ginsengisegetis]|uniref:non-ribosomal peptide synthetase n=1 Tax=Chitinophaga ginsengisegetis TaxID=393003 RepID=UPI000DC024F9
MPENIDELLKILREKNITPQIDKDRNLNIKSPQGTLTPELIAAISGKKQELVAYLVELEENSMLKRTIPRAPAAASYPLSSAQKRLWVINEIWKDSVAYNIPAVLPTRKYFDPVLFKRAFFAVLERYEILRTVFREDESGEIRQYILSAAGLNAKFLYIDLADEEKEEAEQKAQQLIATDKQQRFDLSQGPLFRIMLFHFKDDSGLLYANMHHIISDAWSANILVKDLMEYYRAFRKGVAPRLPSLVIHYKDYAVWQQQQLTTPKFKKHQQYWHQQFAGDIPVLDLFAKISRPAIQSHNGYMLTTRINRNLAGKLKARCLRNNVSLFMGIIASLKALFYRYTGQEDMVIGIPATGRNHPDLQEQIGFYLNTLALRTRFSGKDTFEVLLKNVREITLAAYEHQDYPFDLLVEELEQRRDMSRSPLFDVMVILQDPEEAPASGGKPDKAKEYVIPAGTAAAKFDLSFDFSQVGEDLDLQVVFNTDIYDVTAITGLIHHYKQLLEQLTTNPATELYRLAYLSDREQRQLLHTFNNTQTDYERGVTLPGLFRRQVALQPDVTALVFENRHFTYRELDEMSGCLAAYLHTHYTLAPEDLIGIKLHRNEWLIIALLAVLKAGCAYVPVDPASPEERQRYFADDSGYKACIDDALLAAFREGTYSSDCYHEVREDQLAYVLYTSGSSGLPKGCMLEHKGLINRLRWMWERYGFTTGDIVLQKTTFTFDVSVWELFVPLCFGAKMVLSNDETVYSPIQLATLINSQQVTSLHFVPVLLQSFIENTDVASLTSLKRVFASGEALSPATVAAWYAVTDVPLYNLYGPTEASIEVSYYDTLPGIDKVPIGKPIANTHLHILDQYGQLVPVGVAGEIYIGGIQLARGYHHRPELTAERFIDHTLLHERLYRTGDLGRWIPDGNIEYLGRMDNQVKVRGYRIELGEIEHVLQSIPGISAAVVIARHQDGGGYLLSAYFTGETTPEHRWLRKQLMLKLPEYMVPAYFTQLEHFPLTPSGKVDRKSLPAPAIKATDNKVLYIAPRNETEAVLVTVCERLFKQTDIGVSTSFFDLGGDSIKAILLASQLKQRGYTIKVGDILKYPVLEELVFHVHAADNIITEQSAVEGDVVLMPVQQWFLSGTYQRKHHYNQSVLLSSRLPVEVTVLDQSLAHLVKHHDALRMVFRYEDGVWQQHNQGIEKPGYHLEKYDLREHADPEGRMTILCYGLQESINLEQGPLVKAGLFHLPAGDRLLLVIHHLVVDGVSWRILLEDLSTLYVQLSQGQHAQLPLKSDSFRDWGHQQQQQANSPALSGEWAYWTSLAAGTGEPLPLDMPSGANVIASSASEGFVLEENITHLLQTKAHSVYHTDINDILLSCLLQSVQEVFQQHRLLLTLEGHGREETGGSVNISRTVGWFTSMYPVLLEGIPGEEAEDTLIRVKDHLRRLPNKGIGYGMLRYLNAIG